MTTKVIEKSDDDLQYLLDALPNEFMHTTSKQQTIAIELYRLLARGNPVSKIEIAKCADVKTNEIDDFFELVGGVYFNDDKNIIGFWGISIVPMKHKFIVNHKTLYAWCAWDTLFLTGILDETAEILSECPVSNESIYLKVKPKEIIETSPKSTVISFIKPDADGIKQDVISSFCQSILFFKSIKESEAWIKEHPSTFTLSLSDALKLANMMNKQKYPIIL